MAASSSPSTNGTRRAARPSAAASSTPPPAPARRPKRAASAGDEESSLPFKPITRPPSRARANARKTLADALVAKFGHDAASATAIARAVVDPTRVRLQLGAPIEERVPGGTLFMVHTQVWPAAISPSPINPRAAGDRIYPAGAHGDPRVAVPRRPLVAAGSAANGLPVLALDVEDPDHLVASLQDSMDVLMSTADKLLADIPEQGVMRPVTVVALRVTHGDGAPTMTVPATPDGSSRTTIAWSKWGLETGAEVYNVVDDRRLGDKISNVERLAQKDSTQLVEDERVLLRLATMPAVLIVGYQADLGSTVSFAEAVEAWVAMIHVDPPRPWGTAADLDTKATAILESFARQMNWTPEFIQYLTGNLTPAAAQAAGFGPTADARAVEILTSLGDDDRKKILNDGLRRLGARRPRRPERLEPLVELILRPLRGNATPAEIGVARTILSNLKDLAEWNRPGWEASRLALDELYDLAEQERGDAEAQGEDYEDVAVAGPYALELGFLAAFWLARHGGLRRQTRGALGSGDDREPEHLLRAMMTSEYGLRVLRHVVEDGRAGIAPRAITTSGVVATDATGAEIPVTTSWLKGAFPAEAAAKPTTGTPDFTRAVIRVREQTDEMHQAVRALMDMRGAGGNKLAKHLGVKPSTVEDLRKKLAWASDQLAYCATIWRDRHDGDEPDDDADEYGDDEVDEDEAV
jgi:hypothetical protein